MMEQFSWQAFWLVCLVINLIWYSAVLLIFYRKEVRRFLEKRHFGADPESKAERFNKQAILQVEQEPKKSEPIVELMGKSRLPQGVEVLSSNQVAFTATDDDRYDQLGLVADVVQELKEIFSALEKRDGSKTDFFRMVEQVKEDYGSISGHPNIGSINDFIRKSAPFQISTEELDHLWY